MIQKLLLKIYGPDWKTSVSADLSFVMYACTILAGYTFTGTNFPKWAAAIPGAAGGIAALCKTLVGRLQVDAGTQVAVDKKTGEVVIADSHEVPFDKNLKPIVDPSKEP